MYMYIYIYIYIYTRLYVYVRVCVSIIDRMNARPTYSPSLPFPVHSRYICHTGRFEFCMRFP